MKNVNRKETWTEKLLLAACAFLAALSSMAVGIYGAFLALILSALCPEFADFADDFWPLVAKIAICLLFGLIFAMLLSSLFNVLRNAERVYREVYGFAVVSYGAILGLLFTPFAIVTWIIDGGNSLIRLSINGASVIIAGVNALLLFLLIAVVKIAKQHYKKLGYAVEPKKKMVKTE